MLIVGSMAGQRNRRNGVGGSCFMDVCALTLSVTVTGTLNGRLGRSVTSRHIVPQHLYFAKRKFGAQLFACI